MDLSDYTRLKKRTEALLQERGRAEGTLREALRALRQEFGVEGLNAAEALAEEKRAAARRCQDRAAELLRALREKYGGQLLGE